MTLADVTDRPSTSAPSFLYFDLGNVLVTFDRQVAFEQIARVAGTTPERVCQTLEEDGLQGRYEAGQLTSREFYESLCEQFDSRPDYDELIQAASAIFAPNMPVVPIVTQLAMANHRMGILSNTCEVHWQYCTDRRYNILRTAFETAVLSYRVGTLKPDEKIYAAAAEAAGVPPGEIFFVDDRPENVEGARQFGFDAIQYTAADALASALRDRGIQLNY